MAAVPPHNSATPVPDRVARLAAGLVAAGSRIDTNTKEVASRVLAPDTASQEAQKREERNALLEEYFKDESKK